MMTALVQWSHVANEADRWIERVSKLELSSLHYIYCNKL